MELFKTPSLTGTAEMGPTGGSRRSSPAKRAAFHGLPRLDRTLYDTLFRLDEGRRFAASPDVSEFSRVALSCPAEDGAPQGPDLANAAAPKRRKTLINRVLTLTAGCGSGRKPTATRIPK